MILYKMGDGSTSAQSQKCTPFVSMYSDCTEENRCEGCNRCSCTSGGTWSCETVSEACEKHLESEDVEETIDEQLINSALSEMMTDMKQKPVIKPAEVGFVPKPTPPPQMILVRKFNDKVPAWDDVNESDRDEEPYNLEELRKKRSVEVKDAGKIKGNGTITFHHTVDEINEDTLKSTNSSGTLPAAKKDMIPMVSRRSSSSNNASTPLQIAYSPPLHSQHASDNKVDSSAIHDDQLDLLVHHKMYELVGNESQAKRDKDLSKIVVNELKSGVTETIGNKDSPIISNITFTPENDTLTAMAFIAGNLLNKLWNMEKDTDDSLETENMKHKKINDLLELFKEPLNLRQETFLKNALHQLSTAIEHRNIGNVSICENIEELKKTSEITDELKQPITILKSEKYKTPESNLPDLDKNTAASEALHKIGNVLDLIKKYERTQNALNDIKNHSNLNSTSKKSLDKDKETNNLTKDEKTTLNVFGNILESLTKLIVPNKKSKKIMRGVKSKNLFSSNKDVKNRFPNLNLTEISLTTKDKIVLDYLTHIQNNPNCLLNKPQEKSLLPNIEGDILLNLSEFLKIKSMSDLLKLVDSENNREKNTTRSKTTDSDVILFENMYTTEVITTKMTTTKKENITRFESTKEKLKGHLKIILEDLLELQNVSEKSINGKNIDIAEVLPCIYKLLSNKKNNNNGQAKMKQTSKLSSKVSSFPADPINKVAEIVNNLKNELKLTAQTRRTNIENGNRPKSAIVWERTVKNLGRKNNVQTRRNLQGNDPISFDDVKTTINKMESSGSNTYKSIAYLAEVPAGERLLLLKTLALDTKRYIKILNDINKSIEIPTTLATEQYKIVSEFLENVEINLNLNGKIINRLNKPKKDVHLSKKEVRPSKTPKVYNTPKEVEKVPLRYDTVKLSRDQIINQLIKNRMLYYLKLKEETGDNKGVINIDLAKKILLYLEIGNDNLARDLFKIFFSEKNKNLLNSPSIPVSNSDKYETKQKTESRRIPEPLIQFEEPKASQTPWMNQDQLIKQLMNIKNMRV